MDREVHDDATIAPGVCGGAVPRVSAEGHLLAGADAFIVLNTVRARMVHYAEDWRWSSYRTTIGKVSSPAWLETDWLLAQFGERRSTVVAAYRRFVAQGVNAVSPFDNVEEQLFLGDAVFAQQVRSMQSPEILSEISPAHRRALALSLKDYANRWPGTLDLTLKIRVGEPAPVERRASMTWAQRLKRVFHIDIEICRECGGVVK